MDSPPRLTINNQTVAVLAIVLAVGTIFGAFWLSRGDHDLKLMSLQAVLTTGGTLLGIAGTLLVGVQAYKQITTGNNTKIDQTEVAPAAPATTATAPVEDLASK